MDVSDGLKQFLLADLYAEYGKYDDAIEIVENQLAIEEDQEIKRVLEYLHQTIETMKQEEALKLDPQTAIKRQAEAKYEKSDFYKRREKHAKAIQLALEALELYQKIEHIEGQILVRHQLALLYEKDGNNAEAVRHAQEFIKLYQELKIVKKYEQIQELLMGLQGSN